MRQIDANRHFFARISVALIIVRTPNFGDDGGIFSARSLVLANSVVRIGSEGCSGFCFRDTEGAMSTSSKPKSGAPAHQNRFAFRHNKNSKLTKKINATVTTGGICTKCTEKVEWRMNVRLSHSV